MDEEKVMKNEVLVTPPTSTLSLTYRGGMSLKDGVDFPEGEKVFFREQPSLAPRRVEDGAGMTLCACVGGWGGRGGVKGGEECIIIRRPWRPEWAQEMLCCAYY